MEIGEPIRSFLRSPRQMQSSAHGVQAAFHGHLPLMTERFDLAPRLVAIRPMEQAICDAAPIDRFVLARELGRIRGITALKRTRRYLPAFADFICLEQIRNPFQARSPAPAIAQELALPFVG